MAARFWWDQRDTTGAANGVPKAAIEGLYGKADVFDKITNAFVGSPNHRPVYVEIPADFCLFMGGTSGELLGALDVGIQAGMLHLVTRDRMMKIHYLRRSRKAHTETVVGLGPWTYWLHSKPMPQVHRDDAIEDKTWVFERFTGHNGEDDLGTFASFTMFDLKDIVSKTEGKGHWF